MLNFRESHSLYIHISILSVAFFQSFFVHTALSNTINSKKKKKKKKKKAYLTHR